MNSGFRAWNKKEKRYATKDELAQIFLGSNGDVRILRYNTPVINFARLCSDEFEIEFWTGRKDMDGKKIYECDRIRLSYGIPPIYDTLIVEYADDEYVGDKSVSGWWMRNTRKNGCSASLCKTYEQGILIVGTIHDKDGG